MKRVLLCGTSYMGEEYLKVFKDIDVEVIGVVGRDKRRAVELAEKYQTEGFGGGVKALDSIKEIDLAIIATSVESLFEVTKACLNADIKNILVEKPGCLRLGEMAELAQLSGRKNACVRIAYNRRFYASVIALEKILEKDPPLACSFDFTEWAWEIADLNKSDECKRYWVLSNSAHVIDTVFYLLGNPKMLFSFRDGALDWHKSGAVFIGSGQLEKCPFNYMATWGSSGRWIIEIATAEGRYRLSPMEELQFLPKKTVAWSKVEIDDSIDKKHKPGLFRLVEAMVSGEGGFESLVTLEQLQEHSRHIMKIAGYDDQGCAL